MQSISTIGLDIAKSVFQVHGVDAAGQVVLRRQLRRQQVLAFFQKLPPCLVGIGCRSCHGSICQTGTTNRSRLANGRSPTVFRSIRSGCSPAKAAQG